MLRTSPDLLTIKALSELSNTHRQTIHYYLRKNVLPPPVRISKTSALYNKSSVELLNLVRVAQEKHRLSLAEIRDLFRESGYQSHRIREHLKAEESSQSIGIEDLRLQLDPPPPRTWIDDLVKRGLVEPEQTKPSLAFSKSSAELVRRLWEGTRMGIPLDTFQNINDRIRAEADRETAQFLASLRDVELKGDAYPRLARLFEALEKFATLRWKSSLNRFFVARFERSFDRFLGQDRQIIFPSESFFERYGLNQEIDKLRAKLAQTPGNLDSMKDLARAYQFRGDWVRLQDLSREILTREPDYALAIGYLGNALRHLERFDESIRLLEDGIRRTNNPLLKVRLGQTLITQATNSGDAPQLLAALIRRAKLAAEALRESENNTSLSRNVRGVLAVDSLMLSAPHGANIPSFEDLQKFYDDVHKAPVKGLSKLSRISLERARLFAAYALFVVLEQRGDARAAKLKKQVLDADPDCLLAQRAPAARKKR